MTSVGWNINKCVWGCGLALFSLSGMGTVVAAPVEQSLRVSVHIVADQQTTALVIETSKSHYLTHYDQAKQRLVSVDIPFSVRATGAPLRYTLTLAHLDGYCASGTPVKETALAMLARLDGQAWPVKGPVVNGQAALVQEHRLLLDFPEIPQMVGVTQACEGAAGIVATVAI